jgi:anaerobic selenocysteine-containing dehydrogenase
MNPQDRARMGLKLDQRVTVRSATGALHTVLVREIDIAAGSAAMYYPEANVLVSQAVDEKSRTPSFKNVAVTIETSVDSVAADVQAIHGGEPAV